MTTALIAVAATPVRPSAPAIPAAANGTSMNPPCAIDEYASMRTMLVWRNAVRLPIVIDSAANTPGGFSEGVNQVALDPSNPAIVYASVFGLGILRSSPADNAGAFQQVFVSLGFNPDPALEDAFARSAFALTTKNSHTRMYVNDGGGSGPPDQPGSAVWRSDNMDQLASALVVAGANGPAWKPLTSSNVADPGYATYDLCTGQCWYDIGIYTPNGRPDTVYAIGSFVYGEAGRLSNARGVVRSTTAGDPDPANNNRTFTDMTFDASSSTTPNSIFTGIPTDRPANTTPKASPPPLAFARPSRSSACSTLCARSL